jgi:hypothetical protein
VCSSDLKLGLSQFDVLDVDTTPGQATPAVQHPRGSLDRFGKPITTKDETWTPTPSTTPNTCPTTTGGSDERSSPTTETPRGSKRRSIRPSELDELSKKVGQLQKEVETLRHLLLTEDSPIGRPLRLLTEKLDSLTSARPTNQTQTFQLPTDGWQVEIRGSFGRMRMDALAIDLRAEQQLLIVLDPARPHFVPGPSDEPIDLTLRNGEHDLDVRAIPNGWSAPLMLGDRDCLLLLLRLVEP